ncbi:hypothetical protein DXG03_009060 [Asterophora parasitica]|uniref:Uncharacterized protein n=1 Tax=Asterophora parasitica TaxID=117018 RepID=A0A9P7G3X9_9AGAR|nr:hypothetical protein DXG03_009060 [Asterophora parasitica]
MPPRLTSDPNFAVCPNFALDDWASASNIAEKAIWARQVTTERVAKEEAVQQAHEEEERQRELLTQQEKDKLAKD